MLIRHFIVDDLKENPCLDCLKKGFIRIYETIDSQIGVLGDHVREYIVSDAEMSYKELEIISSFCRNLEQKDNSVYKIDDEKLDSFALGFRGDIKMLGKRCQ